MSFVASENRARMDVDLKALVSNTKKAAASGDPSSIRQSRQKAAAIRASQISLS